MRLDILTLFPDLVEGVLGHAILGRARGRGEVRVEVHDLRSWAEDAYGTVDDEPYGGGAGMVLKVEPVHRALEALDAVAGRDGERVVLMSPQGRTFRQDTAGEYAALDRLVLVCGRYEGVDERVARHLVDEELSIGDYVLSGGELPALVVVEAVTRLVPGVLGDPMSARQDSHSERGVLDHPHYTRPRMYHGWSVPETLLSGDHERVRIWRRREALCATFGKRPDLLERAELSEEDVRLLEEIADGLEGPSRDRLERFLERKGREDGVSASETSPRGAPAGNQR